MSRDRAQLQIPDMVLSFVVLVAMLVTAPWQYKFIGMVSSQADPFTALLLQLVPPFFILALLISIGMSARRGG